MISLCLARLMFFGNSLLSFLLLFVLRLLHLHHRAQSTVHYFIFSLRSGVTLGGTQIRLLPNKNNAKMPPRVTRASAAAAATSTAPSEVLVEETKVVEERPPTKKRKVATAVKVDKFIDFFFFFFL